MDGGSDAIFKELKFEHIEKREPNHPEPFRSKPDFQDWNSQNVKKIAVGPAFDNKTLEYFERVERKDWTANVLKQVKQYLEEHEIKRDHARRALFEGEWRKQTQEEKARGKQTSSSAYRTWGEELLNCMAAQKVLATGLPLEESATAAAITAAVKAGVEAAVRTQPDQIRELLVTSS